MCRSMVDIQSAVAEIRRGKKKKKEGRRRANHSMKIYMVSLLHRATIKYQTYSLWPQNLSERITSNFLTDNVSAFSALTLLVGCQEQHPEKLKWWGAGMIIWWQQGVNDLHMVHLQSLLSPYQTASLYPSLPWFQHSSHHCHLHRSLQTWLLQFSLLQPT